MKVEIFIAKTPGHDCATAMRSRNSSSPIHWCSSTTLRCIIGIMAYPPPMVKAPTFANTLKMRHNDTSWFIVMLISRCKDTYFRLSKKRMRFFSKKTRKKFGGKEKVLIFAARFDGNGSSLKILKDKYKQVPRNLIESRALISLEIESVRSKLET